MVDIYMSFDIEVPLDVRKRKILSVTIEGDDVRFIESNSRHFEKLVRLEDLTKFPPADLTEDEIIRKIFTKVDEMKKRAEKEGKTQEQTFIKEIPKKENFFQRILKVFKRKK